MYPRSLHTRICMLPFAGVVCISFAILSMLRGQPVPDKLIVWWGAVGWGETTYHLPA